MPETLAPKEQRPSPDIPKSRELFRGDINEAVIAVQHATGVEITPGWWGVNVGNDGGTDTILQKFDDAYEQKIIDQQEPETQVEKVAWERHLDYDSPEYEAANQERWADGKLMIRGYGADDTSATVIGTINLTDEGGHFFEHDYSVDSPTIKEIEQRFQAYIDSVPPEQRAVIVEGGFEAAHFDSHDQAISEGAEAGLVTFLGKQNEVRVIGGDPSEMEAYNRMVQEGVPLIDIAALKGVRSIAPELRKAQDTSPNDIALILYRAAAELGVEGIHAYTEQEKQAIEEHGQTELVMEDISRQVQDKLLPRFNDLVRDALEGKDLFVVEDGKVVLDFDADLDDAEAIDRKIVPLWHPDGKSQLSKLWKKNGEIRDRFLFEQIIRTYKQGKKPFVVFGGPHVVSIDPALRAYFEQN